MFCVGFTTSVHVGHNLVIIAAAGGILYSSWGSFRPKARNLPAVSLVMVLVMLLQQRELLVIC